MDRKTGAAIARAAGAATLLLALLAVPAAAQAQERTSARERHAARRAALERQRRGQAPPVGGTLASDPTEAWSAAVLGRSTILPGYGAERWWPDSPFAPPFGPSGFDPYGGTPAPYGAGPGPYDAFRPPYDGFGVPYPLGYCYAVFGAPYGYGVPRWPSYGYEIPFRGFCRPYAPLVPPWPAWREYAPPYGWPWGWPGAPRHRFYDRFHPDDRTRPRGYPEPGAVTYPSALPPAYAGAPAGGYAGGAADAADCARVSVRLVNGGEFRGWTSPSRFGATDARELELAIDARLSEGRPVILLGADGYAVHVPPGAPIDRIVVAPCVAARR